MTVIQKVKRSNQSSWMQFTVCFFVMYCNAVFGTESLGPSYTGRITGCNTFIVLEGLIACVETQLRSRRTEQKMMHN